MIAGTFWLYPIAGALFLFAAQRALAGRALREALFFALGGVLFAVADALPSHVVGALVVSLGLLAPGGSAKPSPGQAAAPAQKRPLGAKLFLPMLLLPLLTLLGTWLLPRLAWRGVPLVPADKVTVTALGIGCGLSLLAASRLTRSRPLQALHEGAELCRALGWAAFLPLLLAALGGVFAAGRVGDSVAHLVAAVPLLHSRLGAALSLVLGMAVCTVLMGNAFAAFPVMMGGIGLPVLVSQHGADPAKLASLAMLSGYCGTLMTPMAANFNIVPAALLELPRYAVLRSQLGTALPLLAVHGLLMYVLLFW